MLQVHLNEWDDWNGEFISANKCKKLITYLDLLHRTICLVFLEIKFHDLFFKKLIEKWVKGKKPGRKTCTIKVDKQIKSPFLPYLNI